MSLSSPTYRQAYEEQKVDEAITNVLFNPKVGRYEVESDVGPAYASQRQEAWNAFVQITTGAPELINEIGDLMFQSADFPMADKIAERIKRKIKNLTPWLLDDQPGPIIQQLQEQINTLSKQLGDALQNLAEKTLKLKGKEEMRDIDVYTAESDRVSKLTNAVVDLKETPNSDDLQRAIKQVLVEMLGFNLRDVIEANKPTLDQYEGEATQ